MKKSISVCLFCFFIDRIIKLLVTSFISLGDSIKIIDKFFNITYVTNDGAAFSIFSSKVPMLIIISIIALIFIVKYLIKNELRSLEYIFYGLLIGGILGNLFDRIVYSSVIDYLDFNIFGYNFPIFNFADICIVVSIGVIFIDMIRGEMIGNKSR